MLKYNTLYQSLKKVSAEWHAGQISPTYYWNYIKFFDDGTVIEASVNSNDLNKIDSNLSKNQPNVTLGSFSKNDREIKIVFNNVNFIGGLTLENTLLIQNQKSLTWDLYNVIDS